jgi:hypothetical protein
LATREKWLPSFAPNQNRAPVIYVCLPQRIFDGGAEPLEFPPIGKMLDRAEEIKRQLDAADGSSRAGLARRLHLTRPRVTQLMKLLDLHPTIRAYIKSLPPGTPERMVTERGLRVLVEKPQAQQLRVAMVAVKGFRAFADAAPEGNRCPPLIAVL